MSNTPYHMSHKPQSSLATKLTTLVFIGVYEFIFIYLYKVWCAPIYGYMGMYNYAENNDALYIAIISTGIITILLPAVMKTYSHVFTWVIFVATYIPSVLVIAMQGNESFNSYLLILALFVSILTIYYLPEMFKLKPFRVKNVYHKQAFLPLFLFVWALGCAYIFYVFRGNLAFVGMDQTYVQRDRAGSIQAGLLAAYLVPWMQGVLNPYIMTLGIFDKKRRWLLILGILGQIFIFMIYSSKGALATIVVMLALWILLAVTKRLKSYLLPLGAAALMVITWGILEVTNYDPTGVGGNMVTLVYMRTFAIQGSMTGVYADFFTYNPFTYYSHVNLINLIIHYPYEQVLGYVIGVHLTPEYDFKVMNANAHFWATDGIAAMGVWGVVLIGFIVGAVLVVGNRIVTPEKLSFTMIVSINFTMSVTNTSFFSSLLTGGGFILFFLILFATPQSTSFSRQKSRVYYPVQ